MPKRHLIKTSLPTRMEIQMKLKRRNRFFCERSLPPYHLLEPIENGILGEKKILSLRKKVSSSPHGLATWTQKLEMVA